MLDGATCVWHMAAALEAVSILHQISTRRSKTLSAADTYIAMIDAANAQRGRIHGEEAPRERFNDLDSARRFRSDSHRELNASLEIVAGFIQPTDVLLDVGGGAGRLGLPLALRCREVINVDPSHDMLAEFQECAAEAGINNVRSVEGDWLDVAAVTADVALSAHVIYFVRDIVALVRKLIASARRRVIIYINSFANPNRSDRLFQLVYGEEQAAHPANRELMEVIWEMGIIPDVKVLPIAAGGQNPTSKAEAIEQALRGTWLAAGDRDRAAEVLGSHFDELFSHGDDGYQALWQPKGRELLITWETGKGDVTG